MSASTLVFDYAPLRTDSHRERIRAGASDRSVPCRRTAPRLPWRTRVPVAACNCTALTARTFDVSYGGIGLLIDGEVSAGDRVVFAVVMESTITHELTARVRHVDRLRADCWRVGLMWEICDEQDEHAVQALLNEASQGAHGQAVDLCLRAD